VNIYQKLIEVRKVVPYLQKEAVGNQYNYVSSSQVLAATKLKMDELGLILIPRVTNHKVSESIIEQKNPTSGDVFKRTTTYFTELDMTMTWVNAEDPKETIECPWYGQGVDIAGEKGVGKALTYSEKYFMLKFFNIPTDKDDPDSFQAKHDDKPEVTAVKTTTVDKPKEEKQKPFGTSLKTEGPPPEFGTGTQICSCNGPISPEEIKFSTSKFGKALCRKCQAEAKKQPAK
jgi:hypothetical protein